MRAFTLEDTRRDQKSPAIQFSISLLLLLFSLSLSLSSSSSVFVSFIVSSPTCVCDVVRSTTLLKTRNFLLLIPNM